MMNRIDEAHVQSPPSKRRRGTAILEAAIAMPLMLMILFGTVEFGLIFMRNQVLMNNAQQGARIASLHRQSCSAGGVKSEVDSFIITHASTLGMTIEAAMITVSGACISNGNVTVQVIYPNDIDLLEGFLSGTPADITIPIGAEATMRNES